MNFHETIEKAMAAPRALNEDELALLLSPGDEADRRMLHDAAYGVKLRHCGAKVSVRGLIEIGNVCAKDCHYCGIRKSNRKVARYALPVPEVIDLARTGLECGYASLVLQSGEIESPAHTAYISECLSGILALDGKLRPSREDPVGITLSLGEQDEDVYRRWREDGATRYLLRIETSNPKLYQSLHPAGHSFERRVECLRALRRCNYQVGTGVMIGLPEQTVRDLARDILFFAEIDADMIGMGPYIPHRDTPLGAASGLFSVARSCAGSPAERLRLGIDMIAATRLHLHDVNIAATTALQALAPDGREQGLLAGANVIMPNVTDVRYRRNYQLYEGKPNLDENAAETRLALERSIASIGETINYGHRGDSPHYTRQNSGK